MKRYSVAVVGATGAVGEEMRRILEEREFPVSKIKFLASSRSEGQKLSFRRSAVFVEELNADSFKGVDLALFSAGSETAKRFAPLAVEAGAVVVDNSSAFRMDPEVPLVVPEVNADVLEGPQGLIANPNCSTIQLVLVLKPIHDEARLKRVVVSTYQSVSGTGRQAIEELRSQSRAVLAGEEVKTVTYEHQIAFNVFPHIDVFSEGGYTKEELKLVNETRKIMNLPELKITATAARVPVIIGHAESVNVETEGPVSVEKVRDALARAPGLSVIDDPEQALYPTPIMAAGMDDCLVGRIRPDNSAEHGLNLWIVADNLRKGAALNAVQIAEHVLKRK